MLLGMPAAKGLFHRASIQSGPSLRASERSVAATHAKALVSHVGSASDLEHFRKLSADQLVKAQSAMLARRTDPSNAAMAGPALDGTNIPAHPFDPKASLLSADVPLIIGTNETEAALLMSNMPGVYTLDWDGAIKAAAAFAGRRAPELVELYRKNRPNASPSDVFLIMASDASIRFPSIQLAERKAEQARAPVYMYLMTYKTNVLGGRLRSPHGLEQAFVFNHPDIAFAGTDQGRFSLARQMSGAWGAFARTGKPDHASIPKWMPYTKDNRATMIFDVQSKLVSDPGGLERIAFLETEVKTTPNPS